MPPKSTVRPQRRTRSAAATRLEIAQGKVQVTCKQPGAKASASQASATAPPPSSPAAQRVLSGWIASDPLLDFGRER